MSDKEYVEPSFYAVLGEVQGRAPEDLSENESVEAVENDSEEQSAPEAESAPELETTEESVSEVPEGKEAAKQVPLPALQEERAKRQQLQDEVDFLRQQIQFQNQKRDQYEDAGFQEEVDPIEKRIQALESTYSAKLLAMSEMQAKAVHSDYDDFYSVFEQHVKENQDKSLYQQVMASEHPAEAAYQAGKRLKLQSQYGSKDIVEIISKVERDAESRLRAKIEKEVEDRILGKALAKNKTSSTNISQARVAGGGSVPAFQPKSFGAMLADVNKRK